MAAMAKVVFGVHLVRLISNVQWIRYSCKRRLVSVILVLDGLPLL